MLARDVAPDRLTAARRAAQAFVDAVPDDLRVGALAFNHAPTVLESPTRDHEAVREALGRVRAAGSTATGDALAAALRLVRPEGGRAAPAAVVLLSDGESVRGRDVLAVAREAAQARVPVYTVALGTPGGTIEGRTPSGGTVTRRVPPDVATLREVARRTGGEAFAIEDAEELERVFARLGSQVATERREREVSGLFAGGALVLLAGGVLASLTWFGRPL
jgi:Ca-activated chloride channel family protein